MEDGGWKREDGSWRILVSQAQPQAGWSESIHETTAESGRRCAVVARTVGSTSILASQAATKAAPTRSRNKLNISLGVNVKTAEERAEQGRGGKNRNQLTLKRLQDKKQRQICHSPW